LMEEFGTDQIIPAGGGMLGHPLGYTAGAKAWRQAIDATIEGVPLKEAAEKMPELKAAIEQWGVRQRPKTAWGYTGKDFHPSFAPKDLD
jgi:2,3-diketo-5-methylthiopentyl-1-phosphate enolase